MDEKEVIEKQVVCETPQSFSTKVEDLVWEKDIPYLDAVVELCEKLGYEPESIPKFITEELKSKIAFEAEKLSLIKKTPGKLDFFV